MIMSNTDLVEAKQDALERVVTRVVCLLMLEVATRLTPVLGQKGFHPATCYHILQRDFPWLLQQYTSL